MADPIDIEAHKRAAQFVEPPDAVLILIAEIERLREELRAQREMVRFETNSSRNSSGLEPLEKAGWIELHSELGRLRTDLELLRSAVREALLLDGIGNASAKILTAALGDGQ